MDYRDLRPLTDRIQDAAHELCHLLDKSYADFPEPFQASFLVALERHTKGLDGLVEELRSYHRALWRSHQVAANLPDTCWTQKSDWYVVAGMPVWKVLPTPKLTDYAPAPADAEVVVYLDEYSEDQLIGVQAAAIKLGEELGYTDFVLTDEEKASIFRRFRGKLKSGLASDFVQQKMMEIDERASIELVGRARAETDAIKASSAVSLIASLADIPNAVVRVGGLLIIKQTDAHGDPAVLTRELSAREIRALELNPGIQKDPQGALELLAAAVAQLEEDERTAQ
jgi:hypothetical protein